MNAMGTGNEGFSRRNKGAWEAMGKSPSLLMRRTHDDSIERYVYLIVVHFTNRIHN